MPNYERVLWADGSKHYNPANDQEKSYIERTLKNKATEELNEALSQPNLPPQIKRIKRQQIPSNTEKWLKGYDIGGDMGEEAYSDFSTAMKKGAALKDLEAQQIGLSIKDQGIFSEQNRGVSVHKEHARSLAEGGSDNPKSQFSGSGRYNVRMGPKDSFTVEQMQTIGRPSDWDEAAADFEAFGNKNLIDLDNQDWLRLQQGKISDNQLVSHKFWVKDEANKGNIWIDAQTTEEMIVDIDKAEARESLKRHEAKKTKKQLKIERSKWPNPKDWKLTKLARDNLTKVSGKLSKADAMAQMGMNISTGNIPGALINASALSAQLVGQSPAVQKKFAELAVKIVAERGAKTTAKLIPGVDVALSASEAWGYLSEGKFDQAGIAALSGAIGWVPGLGDFGAALLDATNTGLDIARLDINQ